MKNTEWHSWFAWYPVCLEHNQEWVWLRKVQRRLEYWYAGWYWDYKL